MIETEARVSEFLRDLRATKWFHAVGQRVQVPVPDYLVLRHVASWPEALKVIKSGRTDEFLTESQNYLYREQGEATAFATPLRLRVREFNDWITRMRAEIDPVVEAACTSPAIPPEVGAAYRAVLNWMVQKTCVVFQYHEHIKRNRLYESVGLFLQAGHCVCGWKGRFPEGNLVVF